MSLLGIRWSYETIRTVTAAQITTGAAAYIDVGTALVNPAIQIQLANLTNVNLMVSFDGDRDCIIIPAGASEVIDVGSNRTNVGSGLLASANKAIRVRYMGVANPTLGDFWATVFYAAPLAP